MPIRLIPLMSNDPTFLPIGCTFNPFTSIYRLWFTLKGKKISPKAVHFCSKARNANSPLYKLPGILLTGWESMETEPVFVELLRSPRIDYQPDGPVRQLYLSYRPDRLAKSIPRNRFLGSINVYKYGLWRVYCIYRVSSLLSVCLYIQYNAVYYNKGWPVYKF